MTDKVWVSATGGSWDTGGNWSPTGVPDLSGDDNVSFDNLGGGYTVTIGDIYYTDAANILTIDDAVTIAIGSKQLQVYDHTVFTLGTITMANGEFDTGTGATSIFGSGATLSGYGFIANEIEGYGVIEAKGGVLLMGASVAPSHLRFEIAVDGSIQFGGSVGSGNSFTFEGAGGSLVLAPSYLPFDGTIYGLAVSGDSSTPVNYILTDAGESAVFHADDNTITINGGHTIHLDPTAHYGAGTVAEAVAVNYGTEIFLYNAAACYCAGTWIRAARGEEIVDVAVEALAIGDMVVTASGAHRPIKWIGERAYSARFARNNAELPPVCFKAGSLAEAVPARDLWVSPKHAMFLDGQLIEAQHLVNGMTILQPAPTSDLRYFHIELETHDVLIAECAASESFLDDDSRGIFQNAHTFAQLYPDASPREAKFCAPRVADGYAFEQVKRRLAVRAGLAMSAQVA